MRLAILTTKTTHHAFFAQEINKINNNVDIFIEKKKVFKKFKIDDSIEKKFSNFEKKKCFQESNSYLKEFNKIKEYSSFNSKKFFNFFKKKKYDLIIVFGSSILRERIINLNKKKIFNLHGGDPEKYRGLDSIYWSIFNSRFQDLVTTLHSLESKVDKGKIFSKKKIYLRKNMNFYEIRYYNTLNCINLCKSLIFQIKNKIKIKLKKQEMEGLYFTAMPSVLKDYCIKKFKNYIRAL